MPAFLLFFFSLQLFAYTPFLNIDEIKSWISDGKVKTVDDLLRTLPDAYKGYFILQHESGSLHTATPEFPRMIFFGPDARLITAVSGNPADPAYHSAEFIEYDATEKKFNFYATDFSPQTSKPTIEKNPATCVACHHADSRPNWEPYDLWPGAFGSIHDTIRGNSLERELLRKFTATLKTSDDTFSKTHGSKNRYQSIGHLGYLRGLEANDDSRLYTISNGVGLNSIFSILVSYWNVDRIAQRIASSPQHETYKYAILASLLECPGDILEFLPVGSEKAHPRSWNSLYEVTEKTLTRHRKELVDDGARLQENGDVEAAEMRADRFGLRPAEIVRTARLRYLLENRKEGSVEMQTWSLSAKRGAYSFNDGVSGLQNLIGHYLPLAIPDAIHPIRSAIHLKTIELSLVGDHAHHSGSHPANYEYLKQSFYEIGENTTACSLLKKAGQGR